MTLSTTRYILYRWRYHNPKIKINQTPPRLSSRSNFSFTKLNFTDKHEIFFLQPPPQSPSMITKTASVYHLLIQYISEEIQKFLGNPTISIRSYFFKWSKLHLGGSNTTERSTRGHKNHSSPEEAKNPPNPNANCQKLVGSSQCSEEIS